MENNDHTADDQQAESDATLEALTDALRSAFPANDLPVVGAALSEFVDPHLGLVPDTLRLTPPSTATTVDLRDEPETTPRTSRKKKPLIPALSTFAGTLIGKITISTSIAVAAAGGAHAAGVIDVPTLPDVDRSEVVAATAPAPSPDAVSGVIASPTPDASPSPVAAPSPDASPTPDTSPTPGASPTPDASPSPSSTPPPDPSSGVGTTGVSSHAVLDAGSVTIVVDGTDVSVVSADPSDGWSAEIETDDPNEAEVNFRRGGERVDFRAEIEDGQLRIRVRDRRTDTRTEEFFDIDGGSSGDSAGVGSTGVSSHAVLDAGSVTIVVDGTDVSVVSADPSDGWSAEIETDDPNEAEVNFRRGGERVDFRAEIEDGQLRIRVRDRRTDTRTEEFFGDEATSGSDSNSSDDSSSNSDDDDDRSGHGRSGHDDDDDDDRSGSGRDHSDDHDEHDDDDRSGSGRDHSDDDDDDDEDDDDDDD